MAAMSRLANARAMRRRPALADLVDPCMEWP
jgi:hypothetical protein